MQNNEGPYLTNENLSPLRLFFRNKWVRLTLLVDVILLIILAVILIQQSTRVSIINFNVTPLDATIAVNGDSKYTNGQYSITPGSYKVTISHEGLETKTFNINISPQNSVSISTFLSDEEKSFDFYQQRANYMSYKKLEEIASSGNNMTTDHDTSAESFITEFNEQYNLIADSLPIRYATYEHDVDGWDSLIEQIIIIQPDKDDSCTKTLCVKALMGLSDDKELVNSILSEKSINPKVVEILYEKN